MPIRKAHNLLLGQHYNFYRVACSHATSTLIAICNAVELKPHPMLGHMLNRSFDLAEAEGWIIPGAVRVEIEGADVAMRAWAQFVVLRHLRIRPGRYARRQRAEQAELAIGLAASQHPLPWP